MAEALLDYIAIKNYEILNVDNRLKVAGHKY